MGYDLEAVRPSPKYPKTEKGDPQWGRYNIAGWRWLYEHLSDWGVNLPDWRWLNDGEVIGQATCLRIANAIEAHLPELDDESRKWIEPHIILWRECGGFKVW